MTLIYQGELKSENLAKARLTLAEIMEAIREHGVAEIADVNLAVLEVDGNISVLSDEFRYKTVKKRKSKQSLIQK